MKFNIDSQQFRDAFKKIGSVVDQKISRPILTNCLIKVEKDHIEIIATDLEVAAKVTIKTQIEKNGTLCINTKNLTDILREMPNQQIKVELDQANLLHLKCQNINYSLLVTSADEYPQLNFNLTQNKFKIKSAQVLEIINKTFHAVSTDETRLYLNGIFWQLHDQKLRAVAIDGHRLALLDVKEFIGESKNLMDGIIIPRKGVTEIKKMAESNPESEITFSVDESFIYAQLGDDYSLSVRLIARDYPKYQTVIPAKTIYSFKIDKNAILTAVKRIKILSNEKTNGIKFLIKDNELTLSTQHPSMGQAEEKLSIDYNGKATDIGFNAKYLLETLQVFPDGEIIIEFNNELSPIVLKSPDLPEFLGIIMPLKL